MAEADAWRPPQLPQSITNRNNITLRCLIVEDLPKDTEVRAERSLR